MSTTAATAGACLHFLFFFILLNHLPYSHANGLTADESMVPLTGPGNGEMFRMILNVSRRKLNGFQICSLCTCCSSGVGKYCTPSPCCYAINCNIPNRPFGFCSFTPKSCNCLGCHL